VLELEPGSDRGTILRRDDLDYYLVRLDVPALYRHADGSVERLGEIIEDIDSREVLRQQREG
jgi:hypothetical protein